MRAVTFFRGEGEVCAAGERRRGGQRGRQRAPRGPSDAAVAPLSSYASSVSAASLETGAFGGGWMQLVVYGRSS